MEMENELLGVNVNTIGKTVGCSERIRVGDAVGARVCNAGAREGLIVGITVGVCDGKLVGCVVGSIDGNNEGVLEGEIELLKTVGESVGSPDGFVLGVF